MCEVIDSYYIQVVLPGDGSGRKSIHLDDIATVQASTDIQSLIITLRGEQYVANVSFEELESKLLQFRATSENLAG